MNKQTALENKLRELRPRFLSVENESHRHNVPAGAESHFKVTVVAEQFSGQPPLARHRLIHELLAAELTAVHALALHTFAPDEWARRGQAPASPPCLGGR